jgi:hypothetical protein
MLLLLFSGFGLGQVWENRREICFPPSFNIDEVLKRDHQETVTDIGVAKNALVQLYRSEKGTFTIVTTKTNGEKCVLASGDGWEHLGLEPSGDPI